MSDRNPNCKRDAGDSEFEASSTSVSPFKKKKKLDDSSADSHDVVLMVPYSVSSSADTDPPGCSVISAGEVDDQSLSICSDCFSSESNEIISDSPTFVVNLEDQISKTESSTFTTSKFRKDGNPMSKALGEKTNMKSSSATKKDNRRRPKEVRKSPTPEEIEEFFSELENDDKQRRFIEKYNFDIVNEKPLEGRYKWDQLPL